MKKYQLMADGKPCGYNPNNTKEDAFFDLKSQHKDTASLISVEDISNIENDSFSVQFASGKTIVYSIEEVEE